MQYVGASDVLSRDVPLPSHVWQKLLDSGKPFVCTQLDRHQRGKPITHPKLIHVVGQTGYIKPQGHGGREETIQLRNLRICKAKTLQLQGTNVFTEQELVEIIASEITERVHAGKGKIMQLTPNQYDDLVIIDRGWCQFWAGAAGGFVPDLMAEGTDLQSMKFEAMGSARKSLTKILKNPSWKNKFSETGIEIVTVKRALEIMREIKVEFAPDGRNPDLKSLADAEVDKARQAATLPAPSAPPAPSTPPTNGHPVHLQSLAPATTIPSQNTNLPEILIKTYNHSDSGQAWARKQAAAKAMNDAQLMVQEANQMLADATKEFIAADEQYHAVMQQLVVQPAVIAQNMVEMFKQQLTKEADAQKASALTVS